MQDLANRRSTRARKDRVPPYSIRWGVVGIKDKNRRESTYYKCPQGNCPFTDDEVRILESIRLHLWPTAFQMSIRNHQATSGRCKCGAIQTISHLLMVTKDSMSHGIGLRSINQNRHTVGVMCHVSCIMCHVSCVMYHVSCIKYHVT